MDRSFRLATLLALACLLAPAVALGQYGPPLPASGAPPKKRTEVTAIAGYQVNSDVSTTSGNVSVGDAPVYGISLATETYPGAFAQLMWIYSEPSVRASGTPLLNGSQSFDVGTHYFQIGGTKSVQRDRLGIFGGATIGAALFTPGTLRFANGTTTSLGDTWRFGFTLGAGLTADLSPHLALRFDARLAAPVYFSSASLYAGSGGAGMAVSGGIPLWQWNFLGGLVLRP
jgi:opacity protein-like surface antigen